MRPQRAPRAPGSPKGARNRRIRVDFDAESSHRETTEVATQDLPFCGGLISVALEPIHLTPGVPAYADVRRIEASPPFATRFGIPTLDRIDMSHPLADLLPIGRKMTKPTPLLYCDRNGDRHECLGEAFDTTHNVLILIYPTQALTSAIIAVPQQYQATSVR